MIELFIINLKSSQDRKEAMIEELKRLKDMADNCINQCNSPLRGSVSNEAIYSENDTNTNKYKQIQTNTNKYKQIQTNSKIIVK